MVVITNIEQAVRVCFIAGGFAMLTFTDDGWVTQTEIRHILTLSFENPINPYNRVRYRGNRSIEELGILEIVQYLL